MAEPSSLEMLANYKAWADQIFYKAISNLPEEEVHRDRAMLFGDIFSLLNHIYAMDIVWKSHLEGTPHSFQTRNPSSSASLIDLQREQENINDWYQNHTSHLPVEKHQEIVSFTFIGGGSGKMKRSEIIQHVVNHASYHRGHIEGVFYQMSVEPPTTDLPVFLREIQTN